MANYNLGTAVGRIVVDAGGLTQTQKTLRTLSLGMIGLGAAAIAGVGAAVVESAKFESIMSGAQAALGATAAQMKPVKELALQLGANSIYGAKNVGLAIEQLAYAGVSIKEIMGGAAKSTIDLAQASGGLITLDEASTTLVNTLRTFHIPVRDAGRVVDILAQTANASTIDLRDMVTSMRYVGPVAATAGVSIRSTAEALGILGNQGLRGSAGGTTLRGIIVSLVNPSLKATGELKKLGIVTKSGANIMFDASGKMKSWGEISQILQDHLKGLTKQQQLNALAVIFQRRAMAGAAALAREGAAGFEAFSKKMDQQGTAAHIAAVRNDNLAGDLKKLRSQVETTLIRAGTPFQSMLRGWVQWLDKVVAWFGKLSPSTQKTILEITSVAGAMLLAAGTFIQIALRVQKFIGLMGLLGDVLAANSFILIVAGIIALAIALFYAYNKVKWFHDFVDAAWQDIQKVFWVAKDVITKALSIIVGFVTKTLWPAIRDHWKLIVGVILAAAAPIIVPIALIIKYHKQIVEAAKAVWRAFQTAWHAVAGAVTTAWNTIFPVLRGIWTWIYKNIWPVLKSFGGLVAAVFSLVGKAFQRWWSVAGPIFTAFRRVGTTVFRDVARIILAVVKDTLAFVKPLIDLFAITLPVVLASLEAAFSIAWSIISGVVRIAMSIIHGYISVGVAIIKAVWRQAWNVIVAVLKAVWGIIKGSVEGGLKFLRGIFDIFAGLFTGNWKKMWNGVKEVLGGAWQAIKAVYVNALNVLISVILNTFTGIVNFFKTVPGKIISALGNLLSTFMNVGGNIIHGMYNGVLHVFTGLKDWFTKLPGVILEFFVGAEHWLEDVGKKIIGGLLNGIKSAMGSVKDFLGSVGSSIISWKGPPAHDKTILIENGQLIMEGLIRGFRNRLPEVMKELETTSRVIQNTKFGSPSLRGHASLHHLNNSTRAGVANQSSTGGLKVHVVEKGDTINIEMKQHDPRDVGNRIVWAKMGRF